MSIQVPSKIRDLLDIATDTTLSNNQKRKRIVHAPRVRAAPNHPSLDTAYQARPGTLAWFYLGTYQTYIQVAQAFIEAPPDEDIMPADKKEVFKLFWNHLPKTKQDARKLYERGLIDSLDLYQESACVLDLIVAKLDINPTRFYQYVEGYLMTFIRDRTDHIRRLRIGHLYEKSIEYGMEPQGFKDRTAILQQEGLHFAPKGASINISQKLQQANVNDRGLPSFEETVHELSDIMNEDEKELDDGINPPKLLPAHLDDLAVDVNDQPEIIVAEVQILKEGK